MGRAAGGWGTGRAEIEIDERARSVRVRDPRAFRAGRRAFCRRLLEAAARRPGVGRAEVDLATASCRVEFVGGTHDLPSMANSFIEALRDASDGEGLATRLRPAGGWSGLTVYRVDDEVSVWETFESPGRMRLRHRGDAGDRTRLARVAETLTGMNGVESCRVSRWSRRLTVDLGDDGADPDALLDGAERAFASSRRVDRHEAGLPLPLSRRLLDLGLAGGSFAMTLVALVIPGLPTVPFLLATGYYLARSSPRLNEALRRAPLFGQILREWEEYGRVSRSSKRGLIGFTLAIVVVTAALTPMTPAMLATVALLVTLSLIGIARMPELAEEPESPALLNGPGPLALPGV
jgi:hypothetical protein